MAKAVLCYDLPDERSDFRMATNAIDYWCALSCLQDKIRATLKWEQLTPEAYEAWEKISDAFNSALDEHNVNMDDAE